MYKQKIEGEFCSDCGKAKYVKSSKTGKIFCADKCWLQGPQEQTTVGRDENERKFEKTLDNPSVKEKEEMKWQEIGAQKNRSNLAAAWIQSNRPIDDKAYRQLAMMEGFVLNGKVEVRPAQPNTPPLIEKIKADPKYQDPKQVTLEQQKKAGDDVWGDLLNQ